MGEYSSDCILTRGESPELEQILHGKRVIVVGRSTCLHTHPESENQGKLIDSYDIVARINFPNSHFRPEGEGRRDHANEGFVARGDKEVLGSRSHLLFTHMVDSSTPEELGDKMRAFVLNGGLMVVTTFPHWDPLSRFPVDLGAETVAAETLLHFASPTFYSQLVSELDGYRPFSGTCAIAQLLSYGLRELRLIGFTFHLLPGEQERFVRFNKKKLTYKHYTWGDFNWLKKKAEEDSRIDPGLVLGELFRTY